MPWGAVQLAIVDAAEAIVAENGLAALSLRKAGARAGQLNNSAVQYHFGSREGLILAIAQVRVEPINEERWQMLAELNPVEDASTTDLVRAWVLPLAHAVLGNSASCYARFLIQSIFDPQLSAITRREFDSGSGRGVLQMLRERTGLPLALARARVRSAAAMVVATLAAWEASPHLFPDTAELTVDLVNTATAVISAPSIYRS
ncbi:MAG: TetR/AcrR family transcriptional regulator [Mycobacterium sp.]